MAKSSVRKAGTEVTKLRSSSFCLTAILIVALCSDCIADDTRYHTTLMIKQKGRMLGEALVYISPMGIRMQYSRSKVILVAKAPDWTIYQFCPETKRYMQQAFKGFLTRWNKTNALFGGVEFLGATATKAGNCQMFGLAGEEFKEDEQFALKSAEMWRNHTINGIYPRSFTYRILAPALFPPEEAHILSIMHAVLDLKGIPVAMRCLSREQKTYNFLSTSSMEPTTVAKSKFELQVGFKQVKEESQLTTDLETESALMDLIPNTKTKP